ncbi:MAG: BACON domain-containing carbohydrate-binding protein [Bacteroidetes bacterium]|nr:BACON domain-containing carbohydrate-binding protein [Bacteroidota bacterium]
MKTKIYTLTALIFLAVILAATEASATVHQVQVGNYFFNPASMNITVGDTVKWIWVSGTHTTTSTSIPAGAASWDQPITSSNTTYSYTVTNAGTYSYKCTPHAAMGMVASFVATNPSNTLSVTPSNQNVGAAGGSTSFSVVSNTSWNASCNKAWCSCSPSGTGNGTIDVTYSENTSVSQRVASITVIATGAPTQTVTVTQAGAAPTLTVTPASQNVTQLAGSVNFNVTSNTDWTSVSSQSWCTVTSSGTGNGTITAVYTANTTGSQRMAMITVSVSGLPDQMVTVSQDAALGINDQPAQTYLIYPNPVRSTLTIASESLKSSADEITIYSISGMKVMGPVTISGSPVSVDVSTLSEGVYFIRIGKDGSGTVKRIIKTR